MANSNVQVIDPQTFPYLPPKLTALRMRHFDPQVFKTDESSRLYKFVDALAGDVGAGQLKKQMLLARLGGRLDTLYFGDLDDAFGNFEGLTRFVSESYPYDPTSALLTSDQWNEVQVKDSWYRQRIKDFFQACSLGGTPNGIRMMLRAALGVDCDIFEVWRYIDDYGQYVEPTLRENLVPNPSFRTNLTGWTTSQTTGTGTTASVASANAIRSTNLYRYTATADGTVIKLLSPHIPVSKNTYYVYSAYTRASATGGSSNVIINWYDVSNSLLSSTTGTVTANTTSGTMTRLNVSGIAPATATYVILEIRNTSAANTTTWEVSGVLFETGQTVATFFDGVTGIYDTSNPNKYRWTGAVNNSSSKIKSAVESYGRLGVSMRNEFVVKPHKATLTPSEWLLSTRMIERIKPADSVVTVNVNGLAVHSLVNLRTVSSDSSYFIVERTVTGVPDLANLPAPEIDIENIKWLQANVPNVAPTAAFGQTQEHSYYYLYSDSSSNSAIDSISYQVEINGVKTDQSPLIEISGSEQFSQWIEFDRVDSPDNYPGGKFGQTPLSVPAVYSNGGVYQFPYQSQQQYIDTVSPAITSRGGEVLENRYRLPNTSMNVSSKARYPQLSLSTVEPTRDSTVSGTSYVRIKGQSAARLQEVYPYPLPT